MNIKTTEIKKILIFAFLYFVVLFLPRFSLISSNVAYFEDWNHPYYVHLQSYRPLAAIELFIMSYFDVDYLSSITPRVMSCAWFALAFSFLSYTLINITKNVPVSVVAVLLLACHPAMNELILWGVLSSFAFSFAVCSFGTIFVFNEIKHIRYLGLILISIGSLGNQLLSTVLFCLFIIREHGLFVEGRGVRKLNKHIGSLIFCSIPILVSIATLLILRYGFEFTDFENRTISLGSQDQSYISSRIYVFTNVFANFYQAALNVLTNSSVAVSAIKPALLFLVFYILVCGLTLGLRAALSSCTCLALVFFVSLAPLLATQSTPSGFRISFTSMVLVMMFLASVVGIAAKRNKFHYITGALLFPLAFANIIATYQDLQHRAEVWRIDKKALLELENISPINDNMELCLNEQNSFKTGILVSYNNNDFISYSNFLNKNRAFMRAFVDKNSSILSKGFPLPRESRGSCQTKCLAPNSVSELYGPIWLCKSN